MAVETGMRLEELLGLEMGAGPLGAARGSAGGDQVQPAKSDPVVR